MTNETGSLWITFNGEIYNHAALRPRARAGRAPLSNALRHRDHPARVSSNTARSACGFSEACSRSPSGTRSGTGSVLRARPAGHQALLLLSGTGGCSPSRSEIKALLEHPAISPALAEDLLPEVLAFGYTSGDRTLFRNIHKLMPGHRLLLDRGGRCPKLDDRALLGPAGEN